MNKTKLYLRLRNRYYIKPYEIIKLGQIAQIIAPDEYEKLFNNLDIYQAKKEDKHLIVIDIMLIIKIINDQYPYFDVINIGNPEIIVEILSKSIIQKPNFFAISFVWLLLFIGSGLAIMNFHHDVSMEEVHQRLYFLVTGENNSKPLILQIPYSLGIGIGMILFFNHLFKKKINEEPSPLEVEMYLYQKNLDEYVVLNENKENKKRK